MKKDIPIPLVIVIVVVIVAVIFGYYTMSAKAKNAAPLSLEESKALMQKMGQEMKQQGAPMAPLPSSKNGP